ncbi:hypothetical protein GDO78_022090 [Eleutherodactylus coqui]|uniref:Uncharacterized protein n=1 Tax=Eleutherodactylus coqui TaxID=57060 RepID=A0A8J6BCG6_ELECQ|nr:hypothetical protein GDO78_022090 [Eleutherodactylus coqui]
MFRKAHVKKEQETTKMWPENWGFLTAQYNKPRTKTSMEAEEVTREIKVPDSMKIRTVTPVEQHIKVRAQIWTTGLCG